MSDKTGATPEKKQSPPTHDSGRSLRSLNKHSLTTFKAERDSRGRQDSASVSHSETGSVLSRLARGIKETGGTAHIADYPGLKVPESASDIETTANIMNTTPMDTTTGRQQPPMTHTIDNLSVDRGTICRKMIVEYLSTRGCTTSDIAIENLVRYHIDTINDTTGASVAIKQDYLNFYAEGWKDCNLQMSTLNMNTIVTKLDPILGNLTNISILLKDNEILKALNDLKNKPSPDDKKLEKQTVKDVSRSLGSMTTSPSEKDSDRLNTAILKANFSAFRLNPGALEVLRREWVSLTNKEKLQLIEWVGWNIMDKFKPEHWNQPGTLSEFAIRFKGARLMQLKKLSQSKATDVNLQDLAIHIYENHGEV